MAADGAEQIKPIHLVHVIVRDDQIERLKRGNFHCLNPVFGLVDMTDAHLLERQTGHFANAVLIIDNQDFQGHRIWHR